MTDHSNQFRNNVYITDPPLMPRKGPEGFGILAKLRLRQQADRRVQSSGCRYHQSPQLLLSAHQRPNLRIRIAP